MALDWPGVDVLHQRVSYVLIPLIFILRSHTAEFWQFTGNITTMFGNRNDLAENSKKSSFGVWPNKCKGRINYTERWRDQIQARANAPNISAVWKHLKPSEKDAKIITSTDSGILLSAASASHVSDEKRKEWLLLVTAWRLKSRNGCKQLVNKLQNRF